MCMKKVFKKEIERIKLTELEINELEKLTKIVIDCLESKIKRKICFRNYILQAIL